MDEKKIKEEMLLKYFLAQLFAQNTSPEPEFKYEPPTTVVIKEPSLIKFNSKPEARFNSIKNKLLKTQNEEKVETTVEETPIASE